MNTEILGVVVQIALMVILAYPLGKYIAKVYRGEKTWSDSVSYTHLRQKINDIVIPMFLPFK